VALAKPHGGCFARGSGGRCQGPCALGSPTRPCP
jgi:hypothetical protein